MSKLTIYLILAACGIVAIGAIIVIHDASEPVPAVMVPAPGVSADEDDHDAAKRQADETYKRATESARDPQSGSGPSTNPF
jgi:hypothetical protein